MGSRSKKASKSLTIKEQEQLLQDLTNMIAMVLAQQEYLKSIGKFEESKEFVKDYLEKAAREV